MKDTLFFSSQWLFLPCPARCGEWGRACGISARSLSPCGRGWTRCEASWTGEGLSPRRETPHPALRATFSHKGRREEGRLHLPAIAAVIQRVISAEPRYTRARRDAPRMVRPCPARPGPRPADRSGGIPLASGTVQSTGCEFDATLHASTPLFKTNLRWLTVR
jgi:hypothetical protein